MGEDQIAGDAQHSRLQAGFAQISFLNLKQKETNYDCLKPRSTELTKGSPELGRTFVYRGSQRKSAACPKFDMVWLYR
jgi:hypothetical protein